MDASRVRLEAVQRQAVEELESLIRSTAAHRRESRQLVDSLLHPEEDDTVNVAPDDAQAAAGETLRDQLVQ
jgi:hypothetical protein